MRLFRATFRRPKQTHDSSETNNASVLISSVYLDALCVLDEKCVSDELFVFSNKSRKPYFPSTRYKSNYALTFLNNGEELGLRKIAFFLEAGGFETFDSELLANQISH